MADVGTSLESLETGEVSNQADAERMAAILRDMNAAADAPQREPMPSMVPRMPLPASDMGAPPQVRAHEDEGEITMPAKRKGNLFNAVFERIKEPLLVACLMFFLSLPMFHTAAAKVVDEMLATGRTSFTGS
jgi:hypothetical protein